MDVNGLEFLPCVWTRWNALEKISENGVGEFKSLSCSVYKSKERECF